MVNLGTNNNWLDFGSNLDLDLDSDLDFFGFGFECVWLVIKGWLLFIMECA